MSWRSFSERARRWDAGDDKRVTGAEKVEQYLQLGAPIAARAADLLGANHLAALRL
jgi:hypothetical protein